MVGRIQRDSIHHGDWATTEQHHKDATMLGYDMQFKTFATSLWTTAGLVMAGAMASAQEVDQELEIVGRPVDGGTGFQPAATELARDVQWLDGMLLVIITAISLFVTGLLAWIVIRYNQRKQPVPATFTHNSPLEVAWTVVPIVILVFIGAFSLPVLFKQQEIPEADITIKVTGYQWYWGYEYEDEGVIFDSFMLAKDELEDYGYSEDEYLLATDTADAVPGRLAQLWFAAEREGIYFGQCSELCGKDHAYMPITVKVVSQDTYDKWLAEATS